MNLLLALVGAHLFADFFLQNEWMATNKSNPRHAAGYVHAAIHAILAGVLGMILGVSLRDATAVLLLVLVTHWLIDLRSGLAWWRKTFGQTIDPTKPHYLPFVFLQDQAAHGCVICAIVAILAR